MFNAIESILNVINGSLCNMSSKLEKQGITYVDLCDDINEDGTEYVKYRHYYYLNDLGQLISVGTFTDDLTTPYTPIKPSQCVSTIKANPEYFVLSGIGTWTMPSNVSAISIYVADIGIGSTPTLTTDSGTRPIYLGQKLDWSVRSNNTDLFVDPVLTVTTTHADDIVTITYIQIT